MGFSSGLWQWHGHYLAISTENHVHFKHNHLAIHSLSCSQIEVCHTAVLNLHEIFISDSVCVCVCVCACLCMCVCVCVCVCVCACVVCVCVGVYVYVCVCLLVCFCEFVFVHLSVCLSINLQARPLLNYFCKKACRPTTKKKPLLAHLVLEIW